jgi:hypothetical protein
MQPGIVRRLTSLVLPRLINYPDQQRVIVAQCTGCPTLSTHYGNKILSGLFSSSEQGYPTVSRDMPQSANNLSVDEAEKGNTIVSPNL